MKFLNGIFTKQTVVLLFIQSSSFFSNCSLRNRRKASNKPAFNIEYTSSLSQNTRRQKEIDAAVNFVAQDSIEIALKEEIDLTEKYDHNVKFSNTFLGHRVNQLVIHIPLLFHL